MTWLTTGDLEEFGTAAGAFLRSRPAENTVPLAIIETLRASGPRAYGPADPVFGWWHAPDGSIAAAFLQTPPHPVLLTRAPAEAVTALADLLAETSLAFPAVNMCAEAAGLFGAQWSRRRGVTARTSRRTRLYRLADLIPPSPAVAGIARIAGPPDRELLVSWYSLFWQEIGEARADVRTLVGHRIAAGGMTLWVTGGEAVSMAGLAGPLAGVARVAPVYTPPGLRRRGYAGAATAAVSQAALDAGARDVVLFTDLANPTSNSIYQRLGYRPVHDRVILSLTGWPQRPGGS